MSNDLLQAVSVIAIALMLAWTSSKDAVPKMNVWNWLVVGLLVVLLGMAWSFILPGVAASLAIARFWDWKGRDLAAKYWPWG